MPEEINRALTDHASDILFCPTETAVDNFRKDGFTNIVNAGNLIIDQFEGFPRTTGDETQADNDYKPPTNPQLHEPNEPDKPNEPHKLYEPYKLNELIIY